MNILNRVNFTKLISTHRGIDIILSKMKPYLLKMTQKIISRIEMSNLFVVDKDMVEDIFQQLQIEMWIAIKKYNSDKGMPYGFLNTHIGKKSLGIIKDTIKKNIGYSSLTPIDYIEDISTQDTDNISTNMLKTRAIKKLSPISKKNFMLISSSHKLNNAQRTNLKSYISRNTEAREAFEEYFFELQAGINKK